MAESEAQYYDEDEDEEMPLTERDLADDAQWKLIQKNTFTRWANEHLKTVNKTIADLENDFSDGLRLVALIEVLSGKKFKHVNRRPNFRTQKLENVTRVLEFLERDEGIRIVNIDSSDIVDSNLKLILGLIWTLILHYSISMPMWEGEEPGPQEGGPTPKQRLLNWVQSKVPDIPIKNFNNDWNNGKAIGALVDAVGPGLCPDWEDWDPKNAKKNAKEAMDAAEKWLDVPQLIKPDEMTNPKIDEMSMMTYLAQFPKAKLKPGAPLRPKLNPNRVRAYGPGLEPKGNQVGAPARFTVETFSAGSGSLEITVLNPKGQKEQCEVVDNKDRNMTYSCVYVPSTEGEYKVIIKFGAKEVNKSPFKVKVEGAAGDASKVTASGPGIEKTGVVASKRTYFEVFTKNSGAPIPKKEAGKGNVDVVILDPHGRKDTIRPSINLAPGKEKEGIYLVEYVALETGLHSVNVYFAGQQIPKSPFGVGVGAASNAKMCYATGRGIQPRGVRVKDNAPFKIHTKGAGNAEVKVQIIGPGGIEIKCIPQKSKTEEGVWECSYIPMKQGQYIINITFGAEHITKSPFKVDVGPTKTSKIRAYGPGLTGGVCNQPARFTVETNGEVGALGFSIEGPSEAKIDCKDNGDGSADVTYYPTSPGEYAIHILCNEEDIPESPYMAEITPATNAFDASKVTAEGPGLAKTGVTVNKWAEFTVDARKAGKAPLKIVCEDDQHKAVTVEVVDKKNGTYTCKYMPKKMAKHTVTITWGGVQIPNSPYRVSVGEVSNPANVKVYGPGVEKGVKTFKTTYFIVDCKAAGPGDIAIALTDAQGKDVPVNTIDNQDGTFKIEYTPSSPGTYTVSVFFANSEIPMSPIKVNVESSIDLSKVKVVGLDTPIKLGEKRDISVITKGVGKADGPVKVTMTTPSKKKVNILVKESMEIHKGQLIPTEAGPHIIEVTYGSFVVPKSPFTVNVTSSIDLSKVKVVGLDTPIKVNEKREISVITKGVGKADGPAKVTATTPSKKKVEVPLKETPEGYVGNLTPTEVGKYTVDVSYGSAVVPKSPFTVDVTPGVDLGKVTVTGLDTPIKVNERRDIAVLTKSAGKSDGPAKVTMTTPTKKKVEIPLKETPEGFMGQLVPTEVGPHKVDVSYGSSVVPKSPFSVNVTPGADLSKVKVTGLDTPIKIGEQRDVAILTKSAGPSDGPARVTMTTPSKKKVEVPVKLVPEGYVAQVVPFELGPHKVDIAYGSSPVPKSPFSVDVVPEGAGKVKAYGPGLTGGKAFTPATFTIDTRECTSPGELGINVDGPMECQIDVAEKPNGTVDVSYMPEKPGNYNIDVTYGGIQIPGSPFKPKIEPGKPIKDLSGVKVFGPGVDKAGVFLDSPTEFTVDAKSVSPNGTGTVRAVVTNPSGVKNDTNVDNKKDGTYSVLYTPVEEGTMAIDVTYDEMPVPQSPLKVNATPGSDATRVRAYGPGLEGGITDKKQEFTVDIKGAGQGGLGLAIDGPAETQIGCKDNHDGTCTVDYLPVKPGDYAVSIKFAEQDIPGSPFNVKVKNDVNPNKVRCYGPGLDKTKGVRTGAPATFTVNTAEAGEAPLEVSYVDATGKANPVDLVPVSETEIQATYYPKDEGKAKVDVQYAGKPVPGSPFPMEVFPGADASKVLVSGPGVGKNVHASMPATFTIDTRNAGIAPLDVLVQRPDGSLMKPKVTDNGDGTFSVQYIPDDLGTYVLRVKFAGKDVPCSPFKVTSHPTGDASKCVIKEGLEKKTVQVNKETVICVDASQAGEGKVTCRIRSPQGSDIDIDIVENADGTFSLLFTPQIEGAYTISIKFGGQTVPGGEYDIQVTTYPVCDWNGSTAVSPEEYEEYLKQPVGEDLITADTVDSVKSAAPGAGLFAPVDLRIPVGPIFNFVSAYVVMPSGKKAYPKIEDNKDGTVTIRYQPTETGLHELHVNYNNQEIEGSPFKFHVDAVNSGHVTAYGPGLTHGIVNEPAYFTIVTKDAGAGGLSLSIEGPSKTEIKCNDNGDGTCTVSYVPTAPGEYQITVKFAGQNISGSPFTSKITSPPGEIKRKSQFGRSSEFELKIVEEDIGNLMATIRTPSGTEEPCLLKRLANGHLGISFTPREVGVHLVNVYRNGHHIQNSPFQITVGESELGNASKVKVSGPGLEKGMANELNEFVVDTKDAGYGGLSLSIEGPSKADIECTDNEDGACNVTYKPTEPGNYIVNVKFADEHVPGSPFNVKVGGEPSPRLTERITRHREAADVMHIGSQCELSLKIPVSFFGGILTSEQIEATLIQQQQQGTSPFDMTASVTNPSGITELCDIVSLDDNHYSIKFVPKEMGVHTVSVKHKDMHIPGSPFEFTVGPIAGGGSHKVHAAGPGLERGEVDQPCDFNIYTREAGAGGLSIAVEGPSKAELDFDDRKDGSCGVTYRVTEPGEYLVSIKFNDEHIPDSPFKVDICPSIGDARKISVSALQQKGLQVGKPAAFVVNFNDAQKGKLKAKVVAPSGTEEEAIIQEIDDGQYAVRFIPRENGGHNVHVFFNDCEIPESPFRIMVGKVDCDPGMVHASGDGLRTGHTGQPAKFLVNTVNAGPGALGVTVEGPSKVKLECAEKDEGYEFTYTPTAPGDYLITIRYAGVHIAGSPFKARIEGQAGPSDVIQHGMSQVVVETVTKTSIMSKFSALPKFQSEASRVTCEGNGLKKAFRGKQATFNVDVTNGGNNMMFVGMMGPKGPCEELCVHHKGGYVYKINYVVKERGDYMLVVKWGEEHIPGSPFCVHCE
ncbi:filamin-A-like isoform X15 [Mytilus californianus]|uniref:filamin-A-like isoform X15 n=1 Tax=Mytilus californianus TaxID=6549 RepID=UPI002246EECF|nr:filamin-A-like isoform X15 [Mytilus californianus]